MTEQNYISNLDSYLENTKENVIIVRDTMVSGSFSDAKLIANVNGFDAYLYLNPEYVARHEYAGCYRFVRK